MDINTLPFSKSPMAMMMEACRRTFNSIRHTSLLAGSPFDIRPSRPEKCKIVKGICKVYALPPVIIPCVVNANAWIMDAYRVYLEDLYLPEFG